MDGLAASAAAPYKFGEKCRRLSLVEIAKRPCGDSNTVNRVLESGWKQGVSHDMADGIVTHTEGVRLDAR